MDKIIEFKDVNMSFEKGGFINRKYVHVLKDVSFSVNRGEILAIVGESGCGKTTIGRLLTGLIKPTGGEIIYYSGEDEGKGTKKLNKYNEMQFVQQDSYAALNPVKTIWQSLRMPLKSFHKDWSRAQIDARINELMAMVGLTPAEQFLNKFPYQMSGGQRQRVLMARALSLEPKLIVADEPVSMIDVSLRLSILKLMRDLNKTTGISFVYITHDLATARYIAYDGRICVLYLGEIMELGDIEKVITNPRHPYTRALLKAVPNPDPEKINTDPLPIKNMDTVQLDQRPEGCPFESRCIYAVEKCKQKIEHTEIDGVLVKCCNLPD